MWRRGCWAWLLPIGGVVLISGEMVTIEDVRGVVAGLPRSYEALVRDRVKFRVGRIVYLAFSRRDVDGIRLPEQELDALVASDPAKFLLPGTADLRYNWVVVRLAAIDRDEFAAGTQCLAHGRAEAGRRGD